MKLSIVTPCFNEEQNVEALYQQVKKVVATVEGCTYEHIFIDNASEDKTVPLLKEMAQQDPNVKVIVNSRNFGHIRSPFHGLLQASGDAVMLLVADFQDPPELIPQFIEQWRAGNEIVIGVKKTSAESRLMFFIRSSYYRLINRLSETQVAKNFTGFGLYDKKIINILKEIPDPYPYFRGLLFELGFDVAKIYYDQPVRKRGITKNNFYTLYDIAMLGIVSHSKVPLRIATMLGFFSSGLTFLIGFGYLIAKLIFWDSFALGTAPIILGIFFFASVQLFFIGILGEYLGFIYTKVSAKPLVIERERVNFP